MGWEHYRRYKFVLVGLIVVDLGSLRDGLRSMVFGRRASKNRLCLGSVGLLLSGERVLVKVAAAQKTHTTLGRLRQFAVRVGLAEQIRSAQMKI